MVLRRALQAVAAEGVILLVYAFARRLGGLLLLGTHSLHCCSTVTVSLFMSKSLIAPHFTLCLSLDNAEFSQADGHRLPTHVSSVRQRSMRRSCLSQIGRSRVSGLTSVRVSIMCTVTNLTKNIGLRFHEPNYVGTVYNFPVARLTSSSQPTPTSSKHQHPLYSCSFHCYISTTCSHVLTPKLPLACARAKPNRNDGDRNCRFLHGTV